VGIVKPSVIECPGFRVIILSEVQVILVAGAAKIADVIEKSFADFLAGSHAVVHKAFRD